MLGDEFIFLDVSNDEAPLPLKKILKALASLPDDKKLLVKHRMEPCGIHSYLEPLNAKMKIEKISESEFHCFFEKIK